MRRILSALLCVLAASAAQPRHFTRLYVFGDSYSDIGEGYLDGNGPTAVAYLAQRLGLRLEPSNGATIAGVSLDFAISGAQTGSSNGSKVEGAFLGYGMQNQVADFAALVRSHKLEFAANDTLFFLAGGLNDSRFTTETTVANLKGEFKTLYSLGARHFALALLPTAVSHFGAMGVRLNPALALIPRQLAAEMPEAQIELSHWGLFFDEVIESPKQYGINNTTDACAGRAIFHQDTTECHSPSDHFFYHAGHPSTAVHKVVGEKLYREITTAPPQ